MAHNERATTLRKAGRSFVRSGLASVAFLGGAADVAQANIGNSISGLYARAEQAHKPIEAQDASQCAAATAGASVTIRSSKHNPDTLRVRTESRPLPEVCSSLGEKSIVAVLSKKEGKRFTPVLRFETTIQSAEGQPGVADVITKRMRTNPDLNICEGRPSKFGLEVKTSFVPFDTEADPDTVVATRFSDPTVATTAVIHGKPQDTIEATLVGSNVLFSNERPAEVFVPQC